MDIAYYGLGLDNPKAISAIWLSKELPQNDAVLDTGCGEEAWMSDPSQPNITIFEMMQQNCLRNIATISSGALPGSIVALLAIDHLPRTTWMGWMFVALAGLFAINGGTFFITFMSDMHALTITLYVLAQFVFNIGPNTMTFILAAELFTTKYRGTFFGIAAASGKVGAIAVQLIMNLSIYKDDSAAPYAHNFAGMLLGFCLTMLLGAFITWTWIPEVQYGRGRNANIDLDEDASEDELDMQTYPTTFRQKLKLPNRPLAHIGKNPDDGHILGMRKNIARIFRKKTHERRDVPSPSFMHEDRQQSGSTNQHYQPVYGPQSDDLEADIGDGFEMGHPRVHVLSRPGNVNMERLGRSS